MRLSLAVIPPRPVLDDLARAVRSVPDGDGQLDLAPPAEMQVQVNVLGNVAMAESNRLRSTLRQKVPALAATSDVWFGGAAALESPGDYSVWATLAGDVDGVRGIGRGVQRIIAEERFYVDRRAFRPWLSVGLVKEETTLPYLTALVDTLTAYRGPVWRVEEVQLLKARWTEDPAGGSWDVVERFLLTG